MPDFHIVNNGEAVRYDNATESLSPELREALLRAFSRARLPDDDPLYAVLVAQAELLNSGFRSQLEVLKSTLDAFVSARKAENKELANLLSANHTASRDFAASIRQAATESQQAVAAYIEESRRERAEMQKTLREIQQQGEQQAIRIEQAANNAADKADLLKSISVNLVVWSVVIAFALGCLAVASIFLWPH